MGCHWDVVGQFWMMHQFLRTGTVCVQRGQTPDRRDALLAGLEVLALDAVGLAAPGVVSLNGWPCPAGAA